MGLPGPVFGFGDNKIPDDYPRYASEDVILLSDGFCGSTCSVFAELMKSARGVMSVAVGGLPVEGPMQTVSGTRGTNVYGWKDIDDIVTRIRSAALRSPKEAALMGLDKKALDSLPPPISDLRYADGNGVNRINMLDILRPSNDKTPLQFAYEPADCRLFYTRDRVLDQSKLWLAAAKVSGGDFSACVKNSFYQRGSGLAVFTDSPGFNNSFQAAVKGMWPGNDTWGASTPNVASSSSGTPSSTNVPGPIISGSKHGGIIRAAAGAGGSNWFALWSVTSALAVGASFVLSG